MNLRVACARQDLSDAEKPERTSRTVRETLQGAFGGVWGGPPKSSSNGSSRGSSRGQRSKQKAESGGTVRQRTRRGQSKAGRIGKGQDSPKPDKPSNGRYYWNITGFPFPLGPLLKRRTIRYEVTANALF